MKMRQAENKHRPQSLTLTKGEFPVIDLKANYGGDRYRVKRDECGDRLIPHRWGHFYAHSAREMACFIGGRRKFTNIKQQFPGIRVTQEGDQEIIFVFPPALFPKLATALKASKKRRVSEAQRQHLAKIGSAYLFRTSRRGGRSPLSDRKATIGEKARNYPPDS